MRAVSSGARMRAERPIEATETRMVVVGDGEDSTSTPPVVDGTRAGSGRFASAERRDMVQFVSVLRRML